MNKENHSGIWIFAENENGAVSRTSLELLAKAGDIKEKLGGTDIITAVILGTEITAAARGLFAYGAKRVIAVDKEGLGEYKHRVYADALVKLAKKYKPSIFLFPASNVGRELAPRVMCALGTGLTADAIDLDVDTDGTFVQTTPNFGGNVLSHIAIPEARPQMCTVHPKVFSPREPIEGAVGELIEENIDVITDDDFVILGEEEKVTKGVPVDKAEIVVAGGFGIKEEADMALLRELAALIGGELGCSRPVQEKGWLGHESQIGQSGATISPRLIVNIGISGSVQYMAGMEKAKCVMSINTDKDAPIFDLSNYGAVEDYRKVLPLIIEEIKQRKNS